MLTMADTEDLAAEGNAADGYTALLAGLRRAEAAEEDGEEWGQPWSAGGGKRASCSRSRMVSDTDSPARIPADQVDALIDAVTAALDLAHQGRAAEGYTVLLEGCGRAQEASTGQPWEPNLVERWRGVLERYGER